MAEFVLLDSDPLGRACRRAGIPVADQCRLWIDGLMARGVEVVVPEIADYELRRELTRISAVASLLRLDALVTNRGLRYAPITTVHMREAARLWADALDADVILAACATTSGRPGDMVIVATSNVGHLARYCDARLWTTIT